MHWPDQPVETIPPRRFKPTHCPRVGCKLHEPQAATKARFVYIGSYSRKCDGRSVPRFVCPGCNRTFSQQSFSTTYYLKKPELQPEIAAGIVAGAGHRQISRTQKCAASTVTRQVARIGRHALLLHQLALREITQAAPEAIQVDDFDSFAYSQFFPVSLPTAIGAKSYFIYGFELGRERRRGRMSPAQKKQRAALEERYGKPSPQAMTEAFTRLIRALPGAEGTLNLVSDADKAIAQAVKVVGRDRSLSHTAYANPRRGPKGSRRSAEACQRDQALFTNDQSHRFLRHSKAAHRRETIAFGRRLGALAERMAVYLVWRNLVQARVERRRREGTPAMQLKLLSAPWDWAKVLAQRLFPSLVKPGERVLEIYRRAIDAAPMQTGGFARVYSF